MWRWPIRRTCLILQRSYAEAAATELSPNLRAKTTQVRNTAIIAHVDHGKTTLVDCLLRQSGCVLNSDQRVMDNNALEKERGITILSKVTSLQYKDFHINVVDTPGHADFGGEVERVLSMVDGCILVVDATEGPMAQTKFVLGKALQRGLKPIVVMNKVDRATSRVDEVDSKLLDLFCTLGASEDQTDYPVLYASAKEGYAVKSLPKRSATGEIVLNEKDKHMHDLFDAIIQHIPPPQVDVEAPFKLLINSLETNAFLGRCALGRIASGKIRVGDAIKVLQENETLDEGRITKIFIRRGIEQFTIPEANAGDIVSIAGVQNIAVNATICAPSVTESLPYTPIDPPTISMMFGCNNSPLMGTEGRSFTKQLLWDRLKREAENNVALQTSLDKNSDFIEVQGRGELQLGILIETLRREGYELLVTPPRVLFKKAHRVAAHLKSANEELKLDDVLEPVEEVLVDVDEQYSGAVMEQVAKRKGDVISYDDGQGRVRLQLRMPTRGLLGYHQEFKNTTHGTGVLQHSLHSYQQYKGKMEGLKKGAILSTIDGITSQHALEDLQARGTLFVGVGVPVYRGMVIGEASRDEDCDVNPVKQKVLTNLRVSSKEEVIRLTPPKIMSLEEVMSYMRDDEMMEVTPKSVRLRKRELDPNERKRLLKKATQYHGGILEEDNE